MCVLCRKQACRDVFFPCEHRCVCRQVRCVVLWCGVLEAARPPSSLLLLPSCLSPSPPFSSRLSVSLSLSISVYLAALLDLQQPSLAAC